MKWIITGISLLLILGIAVLLMKKGEGYANVGLDVANLNPEAPILPDVRQSKWDYYGQYRDYLMDQLVSDGKRVYYNKSIPGYCDQPNRNRNFLVNPLLTQKNIFIKPNIDGFRGNLHAVPDFGNSAEAIRIGSFEELMVPQTDPWYSGNFSKIVKEFKKPEVRKKFEEDYMYRCGIGANPNQNQAPFNTWNNPY